MWDLYTVIDHQLLRVGLQQGRQEGISEAVAQITVKPPIRSMEWLPECACLAVYGDEEALITDQSLSHTRQLPPLIGVSHDGSIAVALDGPGPTYDLIILPLASGEKPLKIAEMHVVQPRVLFVPKMDVMVVIDADPGTTVARNMLVIPLGQIRDLLDDGVTNTDRARLDYDVCNGAKMFIPLDMSMGWRTIPDYPGWFCFWNIRTGGAVTEAQLSVIEYPYWEDGEKARGQIRLQSNPVALSRFWISDLVMRRSPSGGFGLVAVGVSRKAGDFYFGLKRLGLPDPESNLRVAMRDEEWDEERIMAIELRNSDALRQIAGLPDAAGVLVVAEDPHRERRLFRIDISHKGVLATHIDLDVVPGSMVTTGDVYMPGLQLGAGKKEAPKQLSSTFGGAATAKVSLGKAPPRAKEAEEPKARARGPFGNMGPARPSLAAHAESAPSAASASASAPSSDVPEAEVLDAEIIDAELIEPEPSAPPSPAPAPVRVTPAPTPPPAAAPASAPAPVDPAPAAPASAPKSISQGQLPVVPGVGLDLPLAVLPAGAHLSVSVTVVGDGRGANLRWWISQAEGSGDVVYQLHMRAEVQVNARWSARV